MEANFHFRCLDIKGSQVKPHEIPIIVPECIEIHAIFIIFSFKPPSASRQEIIYLKCGPADVPETVPCRPRVARHADPVVVCEAGEAERLVMGKHRLQGTLRIWYRFL